MASVSYPRRGIRSAALTGACLIALACGVQAACATGGQSPAADALPEPLRVHLQDERLQIVTSIRGLPLGVRDAMQTLFGSQTLDIADPGADFQVSEVVRSPALPTRRLVAAGCSIDHCLVYYERGGIAHTWHVALFHWTPEATRFEAGGTAPNTLRTIEDVRRTVLSGTINGANPVW
jgi:hypothetical protein